MPHYVLPALKARGATVKALVTSEDKRPEAMAEGADETAVGNLNDEQSLRSAKDAAARHQSRKELVSLGWRA